MRRLSSELSDTLGMLARLFFGQDYVARIADRICPADGD